ncbi:MAG: hypothetical protein AAGG11_19705 [Pseudomonadota bacterium]
MDAACSEIQEQLEARLNPQVLHSLHGRVRLCWSSAATDAVAFSLQHGTFRWQDAAASTDVTFYFESQPLMLGILLGSEDPIAAFMRGSFRSSGYLLWTFPLLTLFREATSR